MLSFSLVAEALTGLIYHRPSGENSKFAHSHSNSVYKLLTVEYTSPDHSTQVFIIRHNGIRQIKQGWIYTPLRHVKHKVRKNGVVCWECLCQPNGLFKNHQPTRGYTGNHCTISMYTLEKP